MVRPRARSPQKPGQAAGAAGATLDGSNVYDLPTTNTHTLLYPASLLQARRIAALSSLPHLKTLWLDPGLGPEALKTLARLPGLQELRLLGSSHLAHSGHSLQALCGLSRLTGLSFKWTGGR